MIIFRWKSGISLIFAQNLDYVYTLEPPYQGGYNEYPQSMFQAKTIRGDINRSRSISKFNA